MQSAFSSINIVLAAVKFLSGSLAMYIWTTAMKRQTSRMSICLFRSLIQRVSRLPVIL